MDSGMSHKFTTLWLNSTGDPVEDQQDGFDYIDLLAETSNTTSIETVFLRFSCGAKCLKLKLIARTVLQQLLLLWIPPFNSWMTWSRRLSRIQGHKIHLHIFKSRCKCYLVWSWHAEAVSWRLYFPWEFSNELIGHYQDVEAKTDNLKEEIPVDVVQWVMVQRYVNSGSFFRNKKCVQASRLYWTKQPENIRAICEETVFGYTGKRWTTETSATSVSGRITETHWQAAERR